MRTRLGSAAVRSIPFLLLACGALAAEGRIPLNQAVGEAGGLSDADTPGFPIVIDRPGHYVLTGNLQSGLHETAVRVIVDGGPVTLDLNGFQMKGPRTSGPVSDPASVGIHASSPVSVRNGEITDYDYAIDANAALFVSGLAIYDSHRGIEGPSIECEVSASRFLGNEEAIFDCDRVVGSTFEGNPVYGVRVVQDNVFLGVSAPVVTCVESCDLTGNIVRSPSSSPPFSFLSPASTTYRDNVIHWPPGNSVACISGGVDRGENTCTGP